MLTRGYDTTKARRGGRRASSSSCESTGWPPFFVRRREAGMARSSHSGATEGARLAASRLPKHIQATIVECIRAGAFDHVASETAGALYEDVGWCDSNSLAA